MTSRRLLAIAAAITIVVLVTWTRARSQPDHTPPPATAAESVVGRPMRANPGGAAKPPAGESVKAGHAESGIATADDAGVDEARLAAIRFVASTGELLRLGPLKFRHAIRQVADADVAERMIAEMEKSRDAISARAGSATSQQWWIETPITASATSSTATGDPGGDEVTVEVWSVVINAVPDPTSDRPPVAAWRTSTLTMRHTVDGWRVAGFTSVEGPTPMATDQLPSGWSDFTTVAAWPSAIDTAPAGGVG